MTEEDTHVDQPCEMIFTKETNLTLDEAKTTCN